MHLIQLSIFDRHLIRQFMPIFGVGLGLFTSLALAIGVLFEYIDRMANQGLPVAIALQLMGLKLPEFLVLATPMAILLATLLTYAKLARQNEMVAFYGIGISPLRIMLPLLIVSLTLAIAVFGFNNFVVPRANYAAAIKLEQFFQINRSDYLKKDIVYPEFSTKTNQQNKELNYIFYAQNRNNTEMGKTMVIDFDHHGIAQITWSKKATWNPQKNHWQFESGATLEAHQRKITPFSEKTSALSRNPYDFANHFRENREMDLGQAYQHLTLIENTQNHPLIKALKISINEKYSLPFTCIVFCWIGAISSINLDGKNHPNTYGLLLLFILLFFVLRFVATSFSLLNVLPIFWGVWLPNIAGIIYGLQLLMRKYYLTPKNSTKLC